MLQSSNYPLLSLKKKVISPIIKPLSKIYQGGLRMFNNSKKRLIALATTATICLSTATAIYAAPEITKTLKAQFPGIKISYNGQVKSSDKEPFIVDGTTYVPIRMVGELVGKSVSWVGESKQILITDNTSDLSIQLIQKNNTINTLTKENESLRSQLKALQDEMESLKDKTPTTSNLSKLEKQIQNDHEKYKRMFFDISLKEYRGDIEVAIDIDLHKDSRYWSDLSETDIKNYIYDICDDIWYAYRDVRIQGHIYDIKSREYLVEFESDSRQRLSYDFTKTLDINKLEYEMDRKYSNYFPGIPLTIKLSGDKYDLVYKVNVDYERYKSEWRNLGDARIRGLMTAIYNDLEKKVSDTSIDGFICDYYTNETLAEYYTTPSGNSNFRPYY